MEDEKIEKIKTEFNNLLKNRQSEKTSLDLAKEKYKTLLQELRSLVLEKGRSTSSLEDLEISNHTTYQEFNLKLNNVINIIDNQFLIDMANFTNN